MSLRDCERLGSLVRRETGISMGLSYPLLVKHEAPLRLMTPSLLGNMRGCLEFLLRAFPIRSGRPPPTVMVTGDGYTPGSLQGKSRQRLAIALTDGITASRFLTVCDRHKPLFYEWWMLHALGQIVAVQKGIFTKGPCSFSITQFRLGGDHLELWSLFKGVGGTGHRSAFCLTGIDERLEYLHDCHRCSIQEMDAAGFTCSIASKFSNPVYTVTPPLHDTKGVMRLILRTLPGSKVVE